MLDQIVRLLRNDSESDAAEGPRSDRLQLAAATLLVEAASMDDHFDARERQRVTELIRWRFKVDEAEAAILIDEAEKEAADSVQLYGVTATIREAFSKEERVQLVEMLWDVAYADGELDDLEANLLRRVAGLLYVSDIDSGAARKRVMQRYGLSEGD